MIIETMFRGDDAIYELAVTDKVTKAAVDITNCTILLTWKESLRDSSPVLQKTFLIIDPSGGIAEVTIDSADTSSLTERKEYFFDIEITKQDLKKETLIKGKWIIELDVT